MARPRSDIDRRIVRAARKRFLAEGVDGASLRAIARGARTSLGMISYYFPTKDDLFLEVVEEVYAGLLRDLETIVAAETTIADRLRLVSIRVGSMSDHELEVVRLVAREALVSSARFRRLIARFQRGHIPLLVSALAKAVDDGEIDATIPLPVVIGCALGMVAVPQMLRRVLGAELPFAFPPVDETAEHASGVLFRGLGARKPSRR